MSIRLQSPENGWLGTALVCGAIQEGEGEEEEEEGNSV
jgi:hypothetical protein